MHLLRQRRGFTLVELLVVIVIIGVMAMMIAPSVSAGSDAARVSTAVRGVMQISKYARTMALLHQVAVDVTVTSDGKVSVAAASGGGESLVSSKSFSVTNSAAEAERKAEAAAAAEAESAAAEAAGPAAGGGGAGYEMANLGLDKSFDRVAFVFEGYTDSVDQGRGGRLSSRERSDAAEAEADGSGEVKTFRIRYKSNGTCRPYRMRVAAEGDELCSTAITVDMLGAARVEEDE
jgi:prepilin-type N-terminal cleavage/methylation domain-containing protein